MGDGPELVTIGDDVAYVGNRGDSSMCVVYAALLRTVGCYAIGDPADGLSAAPDAVST